MGFINHRNLVSVWVVFCCLCLDFGIAIDTITSSELIKDPETLSSNGGTFTLGFFSPENSRNRYVGIWYLSESNIIWVANRNQPLTSNSSGIVTVSVDGNLVVLNNEKKAVWSSNVSHIASNSTAKLLETGNLVLVDGTTGEVTWESFKHPAHVFVPKMKISNNRITGEKVYLTSWKSPSDPSVGYYSFTLERLNAPEWFFWVNGTHPYYRTGPWNGQVFIGVPQISSEYLNGWSVRNEDDGTTYFSLDLASKSDFGIVAMTPQGTLKWTKIKESWNLEWRLHETICDVYGMCGPFGICNSETSPICSCLSGYQPKNLEEWNRKNWTSGCVRKVPLQCGSEVNRDGFLKLKNMKVPDYAERSTSLEEECRTQCLENCSCVAYAFESRIGCMFWSGHLIDIRRFSYGGVDLYIRVAPSEKALIRPYHYPMWDSNTPPSCSGLDIWSVKFAEKHSDKRREKRLIFGVGVTIGIIALVGCAYLLWKWTAKSTDSTRREAFPRFNRGEAPMVNKTDKKIGDLSEVELQELLLFDVEEITVATNNFDSSNKLGQGGFGPVYKGKLKDGQEIAVKKLSKASEQGQEEFMNEVVVISKLQHRNLVRLLGCCREGDEKMLIYEYMPNKSLDTFVFGSVEQKFLDWRKRFNIIEGIARGLLYLHRDSRIRIIHRDLKASNILLDEELNPKISDFGLARIFGGHGDEANTKRIVGTYGYMAPEYAMEGLFSEKSDVFSFGVLLLEIISGRRNSSFYNNEHSLSLIGFAWRLWNEESIVSLIDPSIYDPFHEKDILRYVHIGLLCVQESARDRPNMATTISMLRNEIVNIPPPKHPAFNPRQSILNSLSSPKCHGMSSNNIVSITDIQGR